MATLTDSNPGASTGTLTYTRQGTDIFTFDKATGEELTASKTNGQIAAGGNDETLTFVYTSGHVHAISDQRSGRSLTFTWTGTHITAVTDNIGRSVSYGYTDGNGNLNTVTDARGQTTTYTYDSLHELTQIQDARGNVITVNHYTNGQIDWQEDAAGTVSGLKTTYAYSFDSSGQPVTSVTSPLGHVSVLTFDPTGLLLEKQDGTDDPNTEITTVNTYDPTCLGVASTTTTKSGGPNPDPVTHVHSWTYDTTVTSPTCELLTDTDGLSHSVQYTSYNSLREPLTVIDRNGHTTTYTYNANGNLTEVKATINTTPTTTYQDTHYNYTDSSHPDDMTDKNDPNGQDWFTAYYANGDVSSTTAPATTHPTAPGAITKYTYDGIGRLTTTVAPNGNVTGGIPSQHRSAVGYDTAGHTIDSSDALGQPIADSFARTPSATSLGTADTGDTWTPGGSAVWGISGTGAYLATASGSVNLAEATGAANGQITFTAPVGSASNAVGVAFRGDGTNSNVWEVLPVSGFGVWALVKVVGGTQTTVGVSAASTCCTANQVATVTFNGSSIKVAIDGVTQITATDSALASNTKVGLYASSTGTGRVGAFMFTHTGANAPTSGYDPAGNQVWTNDAQGNHTAYTNDNNNRLVTTTQPDTSTLGTGYDADGRMTSQTDTNAKVTNYGYSAAGQLASVEDPDLRTTTYTEDALGSPMTVTNPDSQTTTYAYDLAERLHTITYSATSPTMVTKGYDNNGNLTSMSDETGSSSYSYDYLNRLTSNTNGAGQNINTTYDAVGNVLTTAYPASIGTVSRYYDEADREYQQTDWLSNATNYTYDADGNILTQATPNNITSTYTPDTDDQTSNIAHVNTSTSTTLASFAYARFNNGQINSVTSTGVGTNLTYGYDNLTRISTVTGHTLPDTYDPAGNLNQQDSATSNSQAFDAANQLSTQVNGTTTTNYTYNGEGDRTQAAITGGATTTYTYDQANQFTGISGSSAYTFDGNGLRMKATISTVTSHYAWDLTSSLPLQLVNGGYDYIYGADGLPLEQIKLGVVNWLYHDDSGSTRLLSDNTGTNKGSYTYSTWGAVTSHTGSAFTSLQYDGQFTDANGFQYLRARSYDTSTGQFVSPDPADAASLSLYGFAAKDPVNSADPLGLYKAGSHTLPGEADPGGRVYIPPKDGRGQAKWNSDPPGWIDAKGNVWQWEKGLSPHAGPHWNVQHPDGTHTNVDEEGNVIGKDHFPNDDSLVPESEAEASSPECSETILNEMEHGLWLSAAAVAGTAFVLLILEGAVLLS